MLARYAIALFVVLSSSAAVLNASAGDTDLNYSGCVNQCEETGCVGGRCFSSCRFSLDEVPIGQPWDMLGPLYVRWKNWDCQSECRYHCMLDRENQRELLQEGSVKYHVKWPFRRIYGIQEPASAAFSALNLAMHFHGWMSIFNLLYTKLPLRAGKKPYYDFACLWHVYAFLSMNSWFWSAIFHSRNFELTEKLDYSSMVALLGYSLILSILRSFNVRDEASRVMISAPLISFVTTHILYLNLYKLDYGWNTKVCVAMAVTQLTIWAIWGVVSHHPSRWKLLFVVLAGGLAMLLQIHDLLPYQGLLDAHSLWHAITIPLTYLWWSFIRDDAKFITSKRVKNSKKSK